MFGQSFGGSGFGQNNAFQSNNSNMSGNLFGGNTGMNQAQPQPTAFGSTPSTQSTGLFGQASQPATSGFGGFGQPQQQTGNAFGQPQQGSSLFGAKPSPFGASTTTGAASATPAFGAASGAAMTGSGQGTAAVPFQARQEPEPSKPTSTNIYQSISAMPQYSNFSFEELRWQDYQQNRRYGDGNAGGTANAFGGAPSTPFNAANTSTGFGFGAQNQNQGQNQNQTNAFGQPAASNSSPFGQSNTTTAPGMFGQSGSSPFGQAKPSFGFGANTQTNTTGGGLFGSNTAASSNSPFGQNNTNTGATTSTFGGFGQNNQNNITTGNSFGGFGQNNNTNTSGGLFGQSNTNTGGMFGQNNNTANTSGGLFGQKPAGTGMFGQTNTGTSTGNTFGQPATSGGGLFGANSNTNTGASGGLFGANSANNTNTSGGLFGQKPAGTGMFGQTNNTSTLGQTNNTSGGFGFGQNNNNTANTSGGLFGSNTNTAQPSGGLFGANNTNNTTNTFGQSNTSGGLFGNNTNNASNTSGGLFGAKPATTGGFGQTNTSSGGLFGSNTNNTAASSGSSIFGGNSTNTASTGGLFGQSKPATGGLFGSQPATNTTASTGTGLFGQSNTSSTGTGLFGGAANTSTTPASTFGNTSTTGGGLFGSKPAGTTSLFGSTQPAATNTAGASGTIFGKPAGTTSLFGQQANGQTATQQQPALGGSLFGGSGTNTAPAFGAQAAQQPGQPGQSLVATIQQNPYGNNPLFNNVQVPESKTDSFATALTTAPAPRKRLDPLLAFKTRPRRLKPVPGTSSPAASPNQTATTEAPAEKELLLYNAQTDKLILRSEQFAPRLSALKRLVLDSRGDETGLSSVSAVPESASVDLQAAASSTPPRKSVSDSANVSAVANSTVPPAADVTSLPDNEQIDENGYWISPSQSKLDQMSVKELESVEHFRVGRKDVGFVTFEAPVDLSGYSNVRKQAGGHLIVFADRMFALYPQDRDCPAPGQGFNVPATVTLYNLWVKAKDTNQPIKDRNNGLCKRQLKRLKQFPGTKFVSWDPETGTWVFNLEPREPAKN